MITIANNIICCTEEELKMKSNIGSRAFMVLTVIAGLAVSGQAVGEDWLAFRGTDGSGKAAAKNLPQTWDSEQNIVWKTDLPGPGGSCPIIVASRVYLTCYSGYGESIDQPGNMEDLKRHVVCLDEKTGQIVWEKEFVPVLPESEYRPGNDSRHGYASSTLVSDGQHLYAFFGISGLYCLDMQGNEVWHQSVGDETHGWGSATSPVLWQDLVIVNASIESKSLIAFNKLTGEEVWRFNDVVKCWSSPLLVDVEGRQELVLNMPETLIGLDPATGEQLWQCEGIPDSYTCPTVIAEDGVIYAIGGRRNTAIAVRAGGEGDVTDSHVLWRERKGSNVSSPTLLNGHLYWFHESRGSAYCLNASTGEVVFEERLRPKPGLIYSSVTAADGKLYAVSQEEGTYVLAAKPEFELLAVNKLDDDQSRCNASIIVSENRLLLRTDQAIYCIGQ
jgi:outer membrane protein assembly factor BamB